MVRVLYKDAKFTWTQQEVGVETAFSVACLPISNKTFARCTKRHGTDTIHYHCGLFRFKWLPFGITSAPETFQRVMSDILQGIPGIIVYIDDILVYGAKLVGTRYSPLDGLGPSWVCWLRLNWKKRVLRQDRVKYVGHWLTGNGIVHDPDKMEAIMSMPAPTCASDIRRFLSMVTYLGKFVPGLSAITEPLRAAAKADPFVLDDNLRAAFETAKSKVASSLVDLAYFDTSPSCLTLISCNASPSGLGAILWQAQRPDHWQPVACASRALTPVEQIYSQLEREMLGDVFGLTCFRHYVLFVWSLITSR